MHAHIAQFTLAGILEAHPWLADFDCRNCPAVEAADFHAAYTWLVSLPQPPNLKRSCYSLKHDAEEVRKEHISERAFIAAGIAAGFGVRLRKNNAYLTM
jgi:hypothetical protein